MISFNRLGNMGRLGNQMFQYASTLGIARKIGTQAHCNLQNSSLKKCFFLGDVYDSVLLCDNYVEEKFSFNESVFFLDKNENRDLIGYFQTEKYFKHIEDEIKKNFTFLPHIEKEAREAFDILDLSPENTISLHVRRGDYTSLPDYHPIQTMEYYMSSLEVLGKDRNEDVLVVSDDINWCMNNFKGNKFKFITSSPSLDMCVMSMCSSHVIANSSFSWWAAWLSGNATVAPKTWFGSKGPQDWNDIYCEGWTVL